MMITDAQHLDRVHKQFLEDIRWTAAQWVKEDADACAPTSRGFGEGRSGGLPGDPTHSTVATEGRYRHRDEVGRQLLRLARMLREARVELEGLSARDGRSRGVGGG